jgi:hypothetical protein
MQLTPQQQQQIREAKESGQRRSLVSFTPQQRKSWRDSVQQELAAKEQNVAHIQQLMLAAEEPGFFGDVRRAILLSQRPVAELATTIGVEPQQLSSFRAGTEELPSAALNLLIETLGLRLMQEIPR